MHAIPKIVLICSVILLPLMLMKADMLQKDGSEAAANQVQSVSVPHHHFNMGRIGEAFR
jgi:hypothetical protein